MSNIVDAIITKTYLGVAHTDHGILSSYIIMDYGNGNSQGFGGVTLDGLNPKYQSGSGVPIRVASTGASSLLLGIDATFGCNWEDLIGKRVRAFFHTSKYGATIDAIGHEVRDMWTWWDERLCEYNYGKYVDLEECMEDTKWTVEEDK